MNTANGDKAPAFPLGQIVGTPGAIALQEQGIRLADLISRHVTGDFGDLSAEDTAANVRAVKEGDDRIHSAYKTPKGKVWIITEHDRSITTVLLPSEY